MSVKKGDFIEVEYTGTVKEDNIIFDTTDEKVAKDSGMHNTKGEYGPIVICVGEGQLIKGLDEDIIGKEIGKEYSVDVPPEKAFGKKNPKLLKLVSTSVFTKQNIVPQVGLHVNVDNNFGIIRTVTGGRTIVDFNHPLSSKDVSYKYKIIKEVKDDAEKVRSLLSIILNIKKDKINVTVKEGKAEIKMLKLPDIIATEFIKKIKELIPSINDIKFVAEQPKTEVKKQ